MKSLHYCYPTSPRACELKKPRGCWYIMVNNRVVHTFPNSGRWDALAVFEDMPEEVDPDRSFTRESSPFINGGNNQ